MKNLAACYWHLRKLDKSIPLFEETLRLYRRVCGENDPGTLAAMADLGRNYLDDGRLDKAIPLLEQSLAKCKENLPPEHPTRLSTMINRAHAYLNVGHPEKALPLFEEVFQLQKKELGLEHPDTVNTLCYLSQTYLMLGQPDKALLLATEAPPAAERETRSGPSRHTLGDAPAGRRVHCHGPSKRGDTAVGRNGQAVEGETGTRVSDTLNSMQRLAFAYRMAGRLDEGVALMEEVLQIAETKLVPDHLSTIVATNDLAASYTEIGRPDLAVPMLEEAVQLLKERQGPDHPNTLTSMGHLAACYSCLGRDSEALTLREESSGCVRRSTVPCTRTRCRKCAAWRMLTRMRGGRSQALPLCEEIVKLETEHFGPAAYRHAGGDANLAVAYFQAGHYQKAIRSSRKQRLLCGTRFSVQNIDAHWGNGNPGDRLSQGGSVRRSPASSLGDVGVSPESLPPRRPRDAVRQNDTW